MNRILLIETATTSSSVAICGDNEIISFRTADESERHAEDLMLLVHENLNASSLRFSDLNAVAVSSGPGSYTGLRIGVSVAKGLCYGLDIPLIAVPTLEIMAHGFIRRNPEYKGYVYPMIDARRMEVYTALYNTEGNCLKHDYPLVLNEPHTWPMASSSPVCFTGNGVQKCAEILLSYFPDAILDPEGVPTASDMAVIAYRKFSQKQFEDIAWFEPSYLKPFQGKANN